jgi:hypothetical protein
MLESETEPSPVPRIASIVLDYGLDAEACPEDAVELSERGMRLRSHWQFEIGTQLSIAVVRSHPRLGLERVTVDGIVVWCEPVGQRCYESTLLFLELPDELKQQLREFSFPPKAAH